jgi:hypothetical protein
MESDQLYFELLKRIFGNLGAVAGKNFGFVGITPNDYLTDKHIKLEGEDRKIELYNVWAGELLAQNKYKVILTNIGIKNNPEFVAVMYSDSILPIGLRISFEDNYGLLSVNNGDAWIKSTVLYALNITAAIEMITQEGVVWQPSKDIEQLYELLISFLDA